MYEAFIITLAFFTFAYINLIGLFIWGWIKNPSPTQPITDSYAPFVSVVIAIRNEENNVPALLKYLSSQNYRNEKFEVILSDDCSDDNSIAIINKYITENRLRNFYLLRCPEKGKTGKKHALIRAIHAARGEIILTSDADCRMNPDWLVTMAKVFQHSEAQMAIGPVMIDVSDNSIFTRLQALEFMSLTGSTGGAAGIGKPIMCNGANLAFKKEAWGICEPATAGKEFPSGDDVFLLHAFSNEFPGKTHYVKQSDAIVYTQASHSIADFFSQRSRWAGKSAGYTDSFTIATGFLVAGLNIGLGFLLLTALIAQQSFLIILLTLLLKMIIDVVLLWLVSEFGKQKHLMKLFPLLSLLYPFYVITTLILAIFTRQRWKNRNI